MIKHHRTVCSCSFSVLIVGNLEQNHVAHELASAGERSTHGLVHERERERERFLYRGGRSTLLSRAEYGCCAAPLQAWRNMESHGLEIVRVSKSKSKHSKARDRWSSSVVNREKNTVERGPGMPIRLSNMQEYERTRSDVCQELDHLTTSRTARES
jgi:hypothetical protein